MLSSKLCQPSTFQNIMPGPEMNCWYRIRRDLPSFRFLLCNIDLIKIGLPSSVEMPRSADTSGFLRLQSRSLSSAAVSS